MIANPAAASADGLPRITDCHIDRPGVELPSMKLSGTFLITGALVLLLTTGCGSSGTPAPDTATTTGTETSTTAGDDETATGADTTAGGGETATGTVEFRATDAPPEDVTSIVVTVDNVQVQRTEPTMTPG